MKFTDDLGNEIILQEYPRRIISLVPSITELLFDLGLESEIAGVTSYCILPEEKVNSVVKVGGTKKFDYKVIDELRPDLIIGSKEENSKKGIEKLQEKYPVWISDVDSIKAALKMIADIGGLTGKVEESRNLISEISEGFKGLTLSGTFRSAYIIWKEPLMTVGGDTFINDILELSGFDNIFSDKDRYPQITFRDLEEADLILLSTEPYPFSIIDVEEFKKKLPGKKVLLVDGLIYSWYGSRMKYAASYIKNFRKNYLSNI